MNGYNLSGKMKRAPNSDSKTHVKKQNPTSRTEIRRKSLKYLFLETPCSMSMTEVTSMLCGANNEIDATYRVSLKKGTLVIFVLFLF